MIINNPKTSRLMKGIVLLMCVAFFPAISFNVAASDIHGYFPEEINVLARIPARCINVDAWFSLRALDIMEEMYAEIAEETGLNPSEDFTDIYVAVSLLENEGPGIPEKNRINTGYLIASGRYDFQKLYRALAEDEAYSEQRIRTADGFMYALGNDVMIAILPEGLIVGPAETMPEHVNTISSRRHSPEVRARIDKALNNDILSVEASMNNTFQQMLNQSVPSNPVTQMLMSSLSGLSLGFEQFRLNITASFRDEETRQGLNRLVQDGLAMLGAHLQMEHSQAQEEYDAMTPIQAMLSSDLMWKLALLEHGRELLADLEVEPRDRDLFISLPLPFEGDSSAILPVAALAGLMASIAIPNFNRARANAKSRACLANVRTIEAAIEMYNMESIDDRIVDELDLEKIRHYFSGNAIPTCPDGGEYSIDGGFDRIGYVRCSVHGTVNDPVPIDKLP